MTQNKALIQRLQEATEGSRELDAAIGEALGIEGAICSSPNFDTTVTHRTFSTSIDAAMTLAGRERLTEIVNAAWSVLSRKYALHCAHWPEGVSFQHEFAKEICIAALSTKEDV